MVAGQVDPAAVAARAGVDRDLRVGPHHHDSPGAPDRAGHELHVATALVAARIDAPGLQQPDIAAAHRHVATPLATLSVDAAGDRHIARTAGDQHPARPWRERTRPHDAALVDDEAGRLRRVGQHQHTTTVSSERAGVGGQCLQIGFGDPQLSQPVTLEIERDGLA